MSNPNILIEQSNAVKEASSRFDKNVGKDWGLYGHDIGIHDLNLAIGGWINRKVTVVGGRSGMGKTALVTPIIDAGKRVLNNKRAEFCMFSWELDPSFLVDRHISMKTGLSGRMLTQGAKILPKSKIHDIKNAYKDALDLPVSYQTISTNIDVVRDVFSKFCERTMEKSKQEGIDIVPVGIIDFIGMADYDAAGLRTYGIGDFMKGIKQLCNETNGSFFILAQINRSVDSKPYPDRADFADSQSIENNTDNLIAIHRPEYLNMRVMTNPSTSEEIDSKNRMLVRVLKGRDFGIGDFIINSDMSKYRFWSFDHMYDYNYWDLYSDQNFWKKHFKLDTLEREFKIKEDAAQVSFN